VPTEAVMIACFMNECPTAGCFLVCKKLTKAVDEGGHSTLEPWCPTRKNMHHASYTGRETGRH